MTKSELGRATLILGQVMRDTVTGFEGTATAVTTYLGDPTANVRLTYVKDGLPEDLWLSEARLEPVVRESVVGFREPRNGEYTPTTTRRSPTEGVRMKAPPPEPDEHLIGTWEK